MNAERENMSDGGLNVDKLIKQRRKSMNLFPPTRDIVTGDYVSFKSVRWEGTQD